MSHPLILGEFQPPMVAGHLDADPLELPPGYGGASIINLVEARLAAGLFTEVLTLDAHLDEPIRCWEGPRLRLWVAKRRPRKVLRDGFRKERKLIHDIIKRSDASVCHANWTYEYGLAAVTQNQKPALVTVRDHAGHCRRHQGWRYLALFAMTHMVFRKGDFFTAVSPYVENYVKRHVGRAPVVVVPNVLGTTVLNRRKKPQPSCRRVVSAINASELKNSRRALQAFALVRSRFPDAEYCIAGSGLGEDEDIARWARKENLDSGVRFLGCLSYPEMLELMEDSRVLLHPSLEEAFPMSILEGMALQRPVVAAVEAGGARYVLDQGRCGVLVSGLSVESIARGVEQTLVKQDEDQLRAAYARALELSHPDRVLTEYQQIYERVQNMKKHCYQCKGSPSIGI